MTASTTKDLLCCISDFDSNALKPTVASLTTSDGIVFAETLDADGSYSTEQVGRNKDMSYRLGSRKARDGTSQTFSKLREQDSGEEEAQIDTTPSPRLDVDDPGMLEYLKEHGYVVVRSVADADQVGLARDKLWDFLEGIGWCRHDPDTWTSMSFAEVGMPTTGIINRAGVGPCELQWFIRCLPLVQKAFQNVWNELGDTKPVVPLKRVASLVQKALHNVWKQDLGDAKSLELITSFDGINVFRPWQRNPAWETANSWTHVDQGRSQKGFQCVQGFVTLMDATPHTGGLVVVPGSHRYHSPVVDRHAVVDNLNFVRVPLNSPAIPANQRLRLVLAQAGDLVLWDSRTIHANIPALTKPVDMPHEKLLRAVSYVCMTPKHLASEAVLQARRKVFGKGTTGHWPHLMPNGSYSSRASDKDNGKGGEDEPKLAMAPIEVQRLAG